MSPENFDADAGETEDQRVLTPKTIVGVVCFGAGLLILVTGILLVLAWLFTANPWSIVLGIPLALVGVGLNATGLVLLYRGVTGPRRGAGNDTRNP